ncbi:Protein of unknown function, partial [Cotesia congregata]
TELKTFTSVNLVLFVVCLYSGHVALNGTCDNDCTDIIICDVPLQLNENERNFDCTSPTGLQGLCINIADCPPLVRLIKMVPLYQKDVAYLRMSQCGKSSDNKPKIMILSIITSNMKYPPRSRSEISGSQLNTAFAEKKCPRAS